MQVCPTGVIELFVGKHIGCTILYKSCLYVKIVVSNGTCKFTAQILEVWFDQRSPAKGASASDEFD